MGTLQVGGTTLATKNSGTGKVDLTNHSLTLDAFTTFPAGHEVFIKLQNRAGVGSLGSPTTYYPVTVSALSTESFHITLSNSEHTDFSKIKIQWHSTWRINKDTLCEIINI